MSNEFKHHAKKQTSRISISDLMGKASNETSVIAKDTLTPNKIKQESSVKAIEAYAEATPLDVSQRSYQNQTLIDLLHSAAQDTKGICFIEDDGSTSQLTYRHLLESTYSIAEKFKEFGLKKDDVLIISVQAKRPFLEIFWAAQAIGIVTIPVPPPADKDHEEAINKILDTCDQLSSPNIVFTQATDTAFLPNTIRVLRTEDLLHNNSTNISPETSYTSPILEHDISPQATALMLLTSGSTGKPKLVTHSHETILARSQASWQHDGFTKEDISLNFFPLDHVGGLVMFHIRDVWTQSQQIQASMPLFLENPLVWLDWVHEYRASVTWAPNFAFALINSQNFGSHKWDLSCLRFILNGGERIVATQAQKFVQTLAPFGLPNDAMKPSWGMSETCSGITSSRHLLINNETSPASVSVGPPTPGTCLRIVNDQQETILCGEEGELQVKGPTITPGYYKNDKANAESFTNDGWFKTGDLAILDEHNTLHITGRSKQVIIVNGLNISLSEIESALESMTEINTSSVTALASYDEKTEKEQLVLLFGYQKTNDFSPALDAIKMKVLSTFGIRPAHIIPIPYNEIPRSSIGKVDRKKLKQQLENHELDHYISTNSDLQTSKTDNNQDQSIPNAFFTQQYYPLTPENTDTSLNLQDKKLLIISINEQQAQTFISENTLNASNIVNIISTTDDYVEAIQQAFTQSSTFDYIVHLEGFSHTNKSDTTKLTLARSVIRFAQTLSSIQKTQSIKASTRTPVIIATHLGQNLANENSNPDREALIGLIEGLNKEVLGYRFQLIDNDTLNCHQLVDTMVQNYPHSFIALRNGKASRLGLNPLDLLQEKHQSPAFTSGQLVLITGGLGGVGFEVAKLLLERYKVSLAIVGRTALPDEENWPLICAEGGDTATRIKRLQSLRALGNVCYEAADIAKYEDTQSVIANIEQSQNKKISGVIHAAGILAAGSIAEFNEVLLDAALKAKQQGTETLYRVFSNHSDFKFIAISSTTSVLGGPGLAAYSLANAYLNAYCQQQKHVNTWIMNYGRWDDTGLAAGRNDQQALIAEGYIPLKPIEAGYALLSVLERPPNNYFYGLEAEGIAVSRYLAHPAKEATKEKDSVEHSNLTEQEYVAKDLAEVFKEILSIEAISHSENFFDLGVHSLLIPQLKKKVFEKTACDIPSVEFFRSVNIAALSGYVISTRPKPCTNEKVASLEDTTKQALTAVFEDILKIEKIEEDENFFDLGVHSLLIPQLQKHIFEQTNCDIPSVEFFRSVNISALTQYVVKSLRESGMSLNGNNDTPSSDNTLQILNQEICAIFEETLSIEKIDSTENYFDLGVHSLLIPQIKKHIFEKTECDVPSVEFFRAITVDTLCEYIGNHRPSEQNVILTNSALQNPVPQDSTTQNIEKTIGIEVKSPKRRSSKTQVSTPKLSSELVRKQQPETWDSSIVSIKLGGSKSPIFFIHDGDGETMLYLHLASSLDDDRPVYGIRPHGDDNSPILHTRIPDMAAHYIERIRSIQPQGPYYVGGLCAGGVLAFEIACQLQAQGEELALVALLDAVDDQSPSIRGRITRKRLNSFKSALHQSNGNSGFKKLSDITKTTFKKATNTLRYECKNQLERIQNKVKMRLYSHYLDKGLEIPKFLHNIPVRVAYQFAVQKATQETFSGKVLLFRATETILNDHPSIDDTPNIEKHSDPLFGWGKRVKGEVVVHDVPGGHSSCLHEPYVHVIAEKMESHINESV